MVTIRKRPAEESAMGVLADGNRGVESIVLSAGVTIVPDLVTYGCPHVERATRMVPTRVSKCLR